MYHLGMSFCCLYCSFFFVKLNFCYFTPFSVALSYYFHAYTTNKPTNQPNKRASQPSIHPASQPVSQSHSFFGQSLRFKHSFPFILGSLCFYSHHQHIYLRDVLMTSENELTKIVDYIVFVYFCSSIIVVYFVRVVCMLCIWPN